MTSSYQGVMQNQLIVALVFVAVGGHLANSVELHATCTVDKTSGKTGHPIEGVIEFMQKDNENVEIKVNLTGFKSDDSQRIHGFHIHANESLENACAAAAGHFNPNGVNHGGPNSTVRHVGDLGNIEEDYNGNVIIEFKDHLVKLTGDDSVINKAMVIHEVEDDFGLGGETDSLTTGHAGSRLACCQILRDLEDINGAQIITQSLSVTFFLVAVIRFL